MEWLQNVTGIDQEFFGWFIVLSAWLSYDLGFTNITKELSERIAPRYENKPLDVQNALTPRWKTILFYLGAIACVCYSIWVAIDTSWWKGLLYFIGVIVLGGVFMNLTKLILREHYNKMIVSGLLNRQRSLEITGDQTRAVLIDVLLDALTKIKLGMFDQNDD